MIEAAPYLEEYTKAFEDASVRPSHPQYSKMSDIAQTSIHQALSGELSPKEALDELAKKLEEID